MAGGVMAIMLIIILVLSLSLLALVLFFRKKKGVDLSPLEARIKGLGEGQERTDRTLREEMAKNREENSSAARQGREELAGAIKNLSDSLVTNMGEIAGLQKNQLGVFSERLQTLTDTNEAKMEAIRGTVENQLRLLQSSMAERHTEMREEANANRKAHREEIASSLKNLNDSVLKGLTDLTALQKVELGAVIEELQKLTASNESKLEGLRGVVDGRLKEIQENNAKQLDQMRAMVDEKLQGTLDRRLGESFKQVSDRLEQVHKGLGEMQTLAAGVGDLKKLFANVRARGAWGEVQLGALLADMLTPDQYEENVATKEGSGDRVEFAIRLPGDEDGGVVYLPLDSKFPLDDYQRLVEAQERADLPEIDSVGRKLEARLKACAKEISEKYLEPPRTTDFGLMFLPSEALYAEVARRTGLLEIVRREYRVNVCGPSTLAVTLNAFRMGFRTLAIQRRSSEVWKLLGAVKTQFGQFGDLLDRVKKKLDQASDTVDGAARKSRTIERKLRDVEVLPEPEAQALLLAGEIEEDVEETAVVENAIEENEPVASF
jgi:DNA recombination protein RmuC